MMSVTEYSKSVDGDWSDVNYTHWINEPEVCEDAV